MGQKYAEAFKGGLLQRKLGELPHAGCKPPRENNLPEACSNHKHQAANAVIGLISHDVTTVSGVCAQSMNATTPRLQFSMTTQTAKLSRSRAESTLAMRPFQGRAQLMNVPGDH